MARPFVPGPHNRWGVSPEAYARVRASRGLGVTPATDTSSQSPPGSVSAPRTAVVIALVVLGIGGLWWLNELDDKDDD